MEKEHSDMNENREAFVERMKGEGLEVHLPDDDMLFIDIDNKDQLLVFRRCYPIFARDVSVVETLATVSKSGIGIHVRIKMKGKLSHEERIAWQAALGSDPVRELLSMIRYHNSDDHPTLFVEKPGWDEHPKTAEFYL